MSDSAWLAAPSHAISVPWMLPMVMVAGATVPGPPEWLPGGWGACGRTLPRGGFLAAATSGEPPAPELWFPEREATDGEATDPMDMSTMDRMERRLEQPFGADNWSSDYSGGSGPKRNTIIAGVIVTLLVVGFALFLMASTASAGAAGGCGGG